MSSMGYAYVNLCILKGIACNPTCDACSSGSNTGCINCTNDLFLYEGQCFNICPDGTYPTLNNTCDKCKSPCSTCIDLTDCKSCVSQLFLINSSCVENYQCPNDTYADEDSGECVGCDSTCGTCIGPSGKDCLNCNIDVGFMTKDSSSAGVCQIKTCADGQYLGLNVKTGYKDCLPCQPECQTCTSDYPEYCTKCNKIYVSIPLQIPGIFDCKLCEFFRGLKSPATPGAPCEGIYPTKIFIRNMRGRLKYGDSSL